MRTTSSRCAAQPTAAACTALLLISDVLQVSEQQLHGTGSVAGAASADQQAAQAAQLQKQAAVPAIAAALAPPKPLVRGDAAECCTQLSTEPQASGGLQVKPEDAAYSVSVPEGIPALNLDIMRLCAQMVARNGTKFLKSTPFLHC